MAPWEDCPDRISYNDVPRIHRFDPVTIDLLICRHDGRWGRKLKKENGSPGWARAADLVIMSKLLSLII